MSVELKQQNKLPYSKMSGAGNDFVIFDARNSEVNLTATQIAKISSRDNIGCDQLIIIRESQKAHCLMDIFNSDGSLSGACGNATRCVASILFSELKDVVDITIETAAGILPCHSIGDLVSVEMGIPKFDWKDIPLSQETSSQDLSLFGYKFACVNIGNPHAVTFIKDTLSDKEFFDIGPKVETDSIFLEKTNVEFCKIISDNLIEVRVWERGAGETLACGSGACAVGISAIKHKLVNSDEITIRFKGGDLSIKWSGETSSVIMTGGYSTLSDGIIDDELLS